MTTCFLHTADWQLGKPFASVADEAKRHRLRQERVEAIRRMASLVERTSPDFVVVAGDLFDSPHVTKSTVSAACGAIGGLKVPVFVIPGNHDHGGPGSLWEQEFFLREQRQLAPNLQVLLEAKPKVLDSAILFPAPLLRRHESGNPIAWVRSALDDPELPADLPRIVLAHGTIQGFGSLPADEDESAPANWIDLSSLPLDEMDYVALGDWHGTQQVLPQAWYSGTPEIDRFPKGESNDPGHVLHVTVSRGEPPQVEKVPTGKLIWRKHAFHFSDDDDLERLTHDLESLVGTQVDDHLLQLSLTGMLGMGASDRLEKMLESWEARLVRLKLDSQVITAPSAAEIDQLTLRLEDPLVAAVARQLVNRAEGDDEDAAIARLALRELHAALLAVA
ncbi:DNA repair exonuclease SbcCD nuclease subunit [Haloferula luteola]|uniref:DNA repair exonuclease SbcCD nuclease subunit n=1 Tax=Haloferula luteola TaxID=595692 RepID=A0A840V1V1_9BACT|nr:DNA repair exonuclease [Haloferula luteola]MBB5351972.1 DNA repair exonuclease SbcCD nuclease subunit [Haloferula luteola]